ncbi:MAG: hypothetical protein K2Q06_15870, partial [Parvularculaceae bacterium]|nr:hypothetical protein [Parvularculaceae bacterium]
RRGEDDALASARRRSHSGANAHADSKEPPCAPPLGDFEFDKAGASYDAEVHYRLIVACVARECRKLERAWRANGELAKVIKLAPMTRLYLLHFCISSLTSFIAFQQVVRVRGELLTPSPPLALWGLLCDRSIGFTISSVSIVMQIVLVFVFCRALGVHRRDRISKITHDVAHVFDRGGLAHWIVELSAALKGLNLSDAPQSEHKESAVAAYRAQWYWRLIDRFSASYAQGWREFRHQLELIERERAAMRFAMTGLLILVAWVFAFRWIVSNDYSVVDFYDLGIFVTLNWTATFGLLMLTRRCLAANRNAVLREVEEALYGGLWVDSHTVHKGKHSTAEPLTPRERALAKLDPFPLLIRRYRFSIQEKNDRH